MEDLINRQTIIDGLEFVIKHGIETDGAHSISAETVLEVVKGLSELGTNLASLGTDCISRQQAIDATVAETIYTKEELKEYYEANSHRNEWVNGIYDAVEAIKQLPPIQPKRGRWILDRSGAYCCSECMEPCAGYVMMKPRDKFCKMCGSRNEVTT